MKRPKTMKLLFSRRVYEAYSNGEVDRWNACTWAKEYNDGIDDKTLREEVRELVEYFRYCESNEIAVVW